jgi:hypothetical protein
MQSAGLDLLPWVMVPMIVEIDDGCEELVKALLRTLMEWYCDEKMDQTCDAVYFLGFLERDLALRNVGVLDVLAFQTEK